jgi:hypothetical protein
MHPQGNRQTPSERWLRRHDLLNFINTLYDGDLHAKRVLSLANATLGVLTSASLAIHAVGRGLAQAMGAMGTLTKHGVKQVDRLLSNQGVNVWTFFAYWTPYIVGARTEVVVALDWTSFAAGRAGDDRAVDVDQARARDAAVVEDGGLVDAEGQPAARRTRADGARGVGEDSVPALERQVGCDQQ